MKNEAANRSGKLKNDEDKILLWSQKISKMENHDIIVKYSSGTLSTFSIQNEHDDKISKNRTRF